ncbi:MAG: hypothetical protein HC903_32080 [Methylacidiphilales bacterium]|nr:hypothetical protein [Candidatus Methylacidiphilales bacterium]
MIDNFAIVIGINDYELLPKEEHLKFAVRDARQMHDFLCNKAQFPQNNVLLCSDNSEKFNDISTRPSRSNLRKLLREEIPEAKNLWFFFAGHGAVGSDKCDYLLPCDGDFDDIKETAISTHSIIDYLRDSQAENIVLVLDMCRNQITGARGGGNELGAETINIAKQQGIITLFSCGRNELSYEIAELKHGAFTYTLLAGLEQYSLVRDLENIFHKKYLQSTKSMVNRHKHP